MQLVATAIIPILVVMTVGFILKRRWLPSFEFWNGMEQLTYFVLTPALFITAIASVDLTSVPFGSVAVALAIPILVAAGLVLVLKRPIRATGPEITSMIQGAIRFNTYTGLIFASALAGAQGVAMFSLAAAIVVPLVNVISVVALTVYGDNETELRPLPMLRQILTNPLILSCLVGIGFSVGPVELPAFVDASLGILADGALVIGTLVVGAALQFQISRHHIGMITLTSAIKLIALPLGAFFLAQLMSIEGVMLAAIVIITALPPAPSSYVLAARMGGDGQLMISITGVQTVLSLATLPLLLALI
ncbi:AEC family transporter [Corynebacterium alimapuense]|uniref:AEC family transporter n=1 Tax=Corynebacterium alimapuense TaxID=1576874 RepID=A0A3M8K9M5_9CORY|nr:AEC family transporter [Corynebacterium alimapuense]RNE49923.1 AEC family transporter [Corynebacterium alimapuense]